MPQPPRDSFAAPVPFADALPPGLELLIERLEQHARAARGAFADNTLRGLAPDTVEHIDAWLAAAQLMGGPLFRPLTKGGQVGVFEEDAVLEREVPALDLALV